MKTTDDTPPTGCPTVIFLSLTWVALGFGLALSMPWLGLLSPYLLLAINVLALSLTLGFIGTCLFHAVRVVRYTGHTLDALPLTLVQALLFSLLFVQISCHLGARHYEWEADPSGWHWVGFVLLHAARAGDILDGLQAYGLNFQPIRHAGWVTATTLVVYRGILSLFLIRLILEWVGSLRQRLGSTSNRDERLNTFARRMVLFTSLFLLWWLATALVFQPWGGADLILWPIENLLRVLDFADVLELFRVRLHQVPTTLWNGTLTLTCRLLMAVALAGILTTAARSFRLRWMGGFGLDRADLQELLVRTSDESLRDRAKQRLRELLRADRDRTNRGWVALSVTLMLIVGLAVGWLREHPGWPNWEAAQQQLVQAAVDPVSRQTVPALQALQRLGPHARTASATLEESFPRQARGQQLLLLDTLGQLGGVEELARYVSHDDSEIARRAVSALKVIGPRAVPHLALGLASQQEAVQQDCRQAILSLGTEAVQPLIDTLTPTQASSSLELIEQLDPYWYLRQSPNPFFATVANGRVHLQTLTNAKTPEEKRQALKNLRTEDAPALALIVPVLTEWLADPDANVRVETAQCLGQIGPVAAPALPDLMRLVENQDELAWVRVATIQALGSIDPRSTETLSGVLIARLKDPNGQVREAAARSLGLLGPGAASAVPALRDGLSDPAPAARRAAIQAVGRMGPAGAPAVPDLIQQLSHGRYQEQAIEALGLIGPAAAAALPDLLKLTTNIGSSRIRRAATEAVGRIGPGSENVDHLPALVARLSDLDSSIRKVAAEGLGRLGPKATVAVPPLLLRLSDTNPAVQQAVTEALTAIDPNWRKLPRPEKTPQ